MTSLLLIISFLIHVVVLIVLFQLYQQNQRIMQERDDTLNSKMQQFINEIKKENNNLQEQLIQMKTPPVAFNFKEDVQEQDSHMKPTMTPNTSKQKTDEEKQSAGHSIADLTEDRKEEMELSLEGKILQLHEAGFNAAEIAEKLTCGKTEVELILNLQHQLKRNS